MNFQSVFTDDYISMISTYKSSVVVWMTKKSHRVQPHVINQFSCYLPLPLNPQLKKKIETFDISTLHGWTANMTNNNG